MLFIMLNNETVTCNMDHAIEDKRNNHCTASRDAIDFCWIHDDVIKWGHFPRYCPFVREIHRSPVKSPHKGQWRGALMVFFVLRLNKRLSKQSWGWWFETPLRSLWRHCIESLWRFTYTINAYSCRSNMLLQLIHEIRGLSVLIVWHQIINKPVWCW